MPRPRPHPGGEAPKGARRTPISAPFWILLALLSGVCACSNDDAVLGVAGETEGSKVSLSRDVQPIFSASCAVSFCHGSPLGAPMSLLTADTYSSLVGATSCEAPPLLRVEAGTSATSYLVIKLEGTQSTVLGSGGCSACSITGGTFSDCGGRMPLGGPYLSDAAIQTIRDWIDQGAENN